MQVPTLINQKAIEAPGAKNHDGSFGNRVEAHYFLGLQLPTTLGTAFNIPTTTAVQIATLNQNVAPPLDITQHMTTNYIKSGIILFDKYNKRRRKVNMEGITFLFFRKNY